MQKRWLVSLLFGILVGLLNWESVWASSPEPDAPPSPNEAYYICTPRIQLRHSRQCTSIGPGGDRAKFARKGIYPSDPLPATPLDDELSDIPYRYLRVERKGVQVYSSLRDALRSNNPRRSLGKGYIFVSWIDRYDQGGQVVYQIGPGEYIRGDNVSRISTSRFSGLTFPETPKNAFGWVMGTVQPSIAPGYDQRLTSKTYYRYQVVQVYDTQRAGNSEWYMVGLGEWIEQRKIAVIQPDPTPPAGVEGDRWISINLYEQTLAAYEEGQLVFATAISSGLRGWWTRPGVFQIFVKLESQDMQGAFEADRSDFYSLDDVPWVMYYDEARAIHGTYWHNNYGFQQSHGCVNLAPADAQWIFGWAEEGTWVYVWDPSGTTPVDPDSYGAGGV